MWEIVCGVVGWWGRCGVWRGRGCVVVGVFPPSIHLHLPPTHPIQTNPPVQCSPMTAAVRFAWERDERPTIVSAPDTDHCLRWRACSPAGSFFMARLFQKKGCAASPPSQPPSCLPVPRSPPLSSCLLGERQSMVLPSVNVDAGRCVRQRHAGARMKRRYTIVATSQEIAIHVMSATKAVISAPSAVRPAQCSPERYVGDEFEGRRRGRRESSTRAAGRFARVGQAPRLGVASG